MTTTVQLTRKFKFGATLLADPAPDMEPLEAVQLYSNNYPFLRTATLSEPEIEGDTLIYTVQKPAVQTKGSEDNLNTLINELEAWEAAPRPNPESIKLWVGVADVLKSVVKRESNDIVEAFAIPLA